MTDYSWAEEVEAIASEVIASVEQHTDLAHANIHFVFRDKATKSSGRTVLASARSITGLNKFLIDSENEAPLFVLEVAYDTWQTLTDAQRHALIDHELCHLYVEKDIIGWKGGTRGHDVEEFIGIVERHGLWKADIAALGNAAAAKVEQLTIDLVSSNGASIDQNKGGRP